MSLTEKNSQNNNDNQSVAINNPLTIFIIAVVFLVVAGGIIFYIDSQTNDLRTGKARVDTAEGVSNRLQPVAKFTLKVVEQDAPLKTGKEVYEATCTTCHATGVAGAPKFGDKAAWAPFIAAGYEDMLNVAINGKGAMPARGGNPSLKDLEVERAMVYMANEAGAGYAEPGEGGDQEATAPTTAKADTSAAVTDADAEETAPTTALATAIPAATQEQLDVGKDLYNLACFACHGTGVAGAPKIGDSADWKPYMDTGLDTMLQIAISGKGAMPPRGTAMNASDDELRDAILYMIEDAR